jgi:ribosomal protein S6E (S10)
MARFYANIQGNRGEATRMGSKASGLYGHIRGWHVGASVSVGANDNDEDECSISLTSGSGYGGQSVHIGTFTAKDIEALNSGKKRLVCKLVGVRKKKEPVA